MSIREMNRIWEQSKTQKTSLLVMLALADMANDEGFCWPGQDTIAEKARTTRRSVISIVDDCVRSDELAYISRPGQQHVYCLLVALTPEQRAERLANFKKQYPAGELRTCENFSHVKKSDGGCEKIAQESAKTSHPPVQVSAQNCTRSINEPSVDPSIDPLVSPQSEKPAEKPEATPKPRPRNPFFDAVCEVCNLDPDRLPPETKGSAVGKVMRDLKAAKWQAEDVLKYQAWRKAKGLGPLGSLHWLVDEMAKKDWQNGNGQAPATPAAAPGTIPKGMEKHNRTDIKDANAEWTQIVMEAARKAKREAAEKQAAEQAARKEQEREPHEEAA